MESLHIRFKAWTASSIESLQELPALCQLDVTLDNLNNKADKKVIESVFILTQLKRLRLDVGPHKDTDLEAYAWSQLSELQGLTFGSCYAATPQQYEFISCLTALQTLHTVYNCLAINTLSCLKRLTGLNVHLSEPCKAGFLDGLGHLTGLRSLTIDGQP